MTLFPLCKDSVGLCSPVAKIPTAFTHHPSGSSTASRGCKHPLQTWLQKGPHVRNLFTASLLVMRCVLFLLFISRFPKPGLAVIPVLRNPDVAWHYIQVSDHCQSAAQAWLQTCDVTQTQIMEAAKRSYFCNDKESEFCLSVMKKLFSSLDAKRHGDTKLYNQSVVEGSQDASIPTCTMEQVRSQWKTLKKQSGQTSKPNKWL